MFFKGKHEAARMEWRFINKTGNRHFDKPSYTKLIHIHSRGFMHMGLAKSDAWWFTRGLWDSLRACSTSPFSRQNHIPTKQQGPHQWVKMPVPRGISLHLHGNAPARAIGVLSQSKLDPWKKWPGVSPLEINPFSPWFFSTLFQTEMEDFTKTHQEALGLPFLQLSSCKLTDSYGKITWVL